MRLVLDTAVVVAALRSPRGASAMMLRLLAEGAGSFVLNVALALEYDSVRHRTEHQAATGLTTPEIDVFVDTLIALAEPVPSHFRWRPVLRDPCDEMVLEAAVNGRADAIATFNLRDFAPVPSLFGIAVMLPGDVVKRLRQ